MYHDGSGTSDESPLKTIDRSHRTSEKPENDAPSSNGHAISTPMKLESTRHLLRSNIHWFVLHGYNVATLNSLECRDSKVRSNPADCEMGLMVVGIVHGP